MLPLLALATTVAAAAAEDPSGSGGLTLTHFSNTASAGAGTSAVLASLEAFPDCMPLTCGAPSSLLLTGRIAPPAAGNYGFQITFDPPLAYPSNDSYAFLWVHDHLLYPLNTGESVAKSIRAGGGAPLWIPLPSRALNLDLTTVEHPGAANLSSYEVRLQYVCRTAAGCGGRKLSLRWATFEDVSGAAAAVADAAPTAAAAVAGKPPPKPSKPLPHPWCHWVAAPGGKFWCPAPPSPPFAPIPSSVLLPAQSAPETQRRALYTKLQDGWGTYYHDGMLSWVLLPESFAVKLGLYRISTGAFLSPEGLTINPGKLHSFAVRAGLHSYDNSYIEAALTWRSACACPGARGGRCSGEALCPLNETIGGGNVNVSIATTVDERDSSQLTMTAIVNNPAEVNASDYMLILVPAFTHGRVGTVSVDSKGVRGVAAGLRTSTLRVIQGTATPGPFAPPLPMPPGPDGKPAPPGLQVPKIALGVSLGGTAPVVLSTDATLSAAAVATKTASYRAKEAATLEGWGEWGEVKDAMQSSLMWSFMFDPKEGLAVDETVILLQPPLHLVGVSIVMERERQQNDSLVNG